MTSHGYLVFIDFVRTVVVLTGAAFSALLLRASLPVWSRLGSVEKWLAITLFLYSADATVLTALFRSPAGPRALINLVVLATFLAGHRYLYFVRKDNRP